MTNVADLKPGYLYRLHARNLRMGVWDAEHRWFVGIREKFGARFLDIEYHRDTHPRFGTATPYEELELCPVSYETDLGTKCGECGDVVEFRKHTDSAPHKYPGVWTHLTETECTAVNPLREVNTSLFAWLDEQEIPSAAFNT